MKKLALTFAVFCALCAFAYAGPETLSGKEMKQVAAPAPCPEFYADNEWNVGLWGAYAFSGTENSRADIESEDDRGRNGEFRFGTYDRFLAEDHAWGGGIDAKYFFHRYFGIGLEGFALSGHSKHAVFDHPPDNASEEFFADDDHTVGAALGTLTLRYPFHCSRFSPYIWAGAGGIFGGKNDRPSVVAGESRIDNEDESRFMGQFGLGLEFRITPHIGWTSDFSWNVLDGPNNDFGMVRTGINFAF